MAELTEMVTADPSLFRSPPTLQQQAAQGVVASLMALEEKAACLENPRVLGPEGEGGSGPFPP